MENKIKKQQQEDLAAKALQNRKPVHEDHQMEFVCEVNGIAFINDSKSTQPGHTKLSVESIDAPIILILGGADNGMDYSTLTGVLNQKVIGVIYIGSDKEQINDYIKNAKVGFYTAADLSDAISLALQCGQAGDAVLFSPGCPCDAFDNYKNRGNQFRDFANSVL